ncbi:MAG: tetratricopeptide repeat protein [Thermodesulfobacteriota bacterium]|nr:tetratricopeptide repeat protein [Thermodesulfobacteriota bacterium]
MGKDNLPRDEKIFDGHEEALDAVANSPLFSQLAEAYRLQGRYDEAIDTCRKGLEKNPDALRGRLILGRCYLEKGMVAEAKGELEKVAEGIEECLSVYKLLSQVYLQEKNIDRALEVLRKALYFPPEEEKPKKGMTPLEMDLLQQKIKPALAPTPPDSQEDAAEERKSIAEKVAKKAIQTDTLAEIYIKQGHPEKALSIYKEILSRDPENIQVKEKYETLQKRLDMERRAASRQRVINRLEHWLTVVSSKEEPKNI